VLRTNLEAIKEVVYQVRFRNIGGLIIIDLIDMESSSNREKVYRALGDELRVDKARTNILKISELGLVEMTRKRTRENLVQTLCEPCAYCEGRGYVLSRESVAFRVLREIRKDLPRFCGRQIAVAVSPQVAEELLGRARETLKSLSEALGREVEIRARPGLHQEQFEVSAIDAGEPVTIPLRWLSDRPDPSADSPKPVAEAKPQTDAKSEAQANTEAVDEPPASSGAIGFADSDRGTAGADGPKADASVEELDLATGESLGDRDSEEKPEDAAAAVSPTREPESVTDADSESGHVAARKLQAIDEEAESRILPPSEPHEES
jgi:hypothetical protein